MRQEKRLLANETKADSLKRKKFHKENKKKSKQCNDIPLVVAQHTHIHTCGSYIVFSGITE